MPKKVKDKSLAYIIKIPADELAQAVKNGQLDPMLDYHFKIARVSMLEAIEKKYVR